ncbi:TauD/TfdA family dioxygenase [Frigoriflavimonas asaccharolytica]|uniref:Alpha-ketoglutarate-dependent taurine dioxygenase n=1 Tax=Frigoriflavimonas asaccharolytica TaxID=2735899 RepID=A0A8J8K5Y3_9FLAO|nr:TauD/TfdA family dioxygenase [Frigoriflavimonas asaccharolytica]NRS93150.1 alpha-ketoglutarate-dependent taurine dioxygenase [Frigoriflavimonas asaccharolytica]
MTENERIQLSTNGWTEFKSGSTDIELISIASEIGNILKHPNGQDVFILKPKLKNEASYGTFSSKHGLSNFPLHTDTAFYKNPARYILMHSLQSNNCETTILRKIDFWDLLTDLDKKKAERAIYLVKTNREKFYTSLIFNQKNESGIKYDSTCMFPFNKYAKEFDEIFQETIKKIEPIKIEWTEGKTLIIDNWKNLHGRKSAEAETNRILKRIYIN